jgi:hypothetical protein
MPDSRIAEGRGFAAAQCGKPPAYRRLIPPFVGLRPPPPETQPQVKKKRGPVSRRLLHCAAAEPPLSLCASYRFPLTSHSHVADAQIHNLCNQRHHAGWTRL